MSTAEETAFEAIFESLFGNLKFSVTEVNSEMTDGYDDENFYTIYKSDYTVNAVIADKPVSWNLTATNGRITGGYEPDVWFNVLKTVVENSEYVLNYAADELTFAVTLLTMFEYKIRDAVSEYRKDEFD